MNVILTFVSVFLFLCIFWASTFVVTLMYYLYGALLLLDFQLERTLSYISCCRINNWNLNITFDVEDFFGKVSGILALILYDQLVLSQLFKTFDWLWQCCNRGCFVRRDAWTESGSNWLYDPMSISQGSRLLEALWSAFFWTIQKKEPHFLEEHLSMSNIRHLALKYNFPINMLIR